MRFRCSFFFKILFFGGGGGGGGGGAGAGERLEVSVQLGRVGLFPSSRSIVVVFIIFMACCTENVFF